MTSNHTFSVFWNRVKSYFDKCITDYHVCEILDVSAQYLERHPVLCLAVIAVGITCLIPIVIFMIFAVISVIITFTGFILIEGTILSMGLATLVGFLLAVLLVVVSLAITLSAVYFTFGQLFGTEKFTPTAHSTRRHPPVNTDNAIH